MFKNWLKTAFANYRKNWISTFINVLGVTVGLTIFLFIYIHYQDEKSYESWLPEKENVFLTEFQVGKSSYNTIVNYPFLYTAKESFPEIEAYTVANNWVDYRQKMSSGAKSVYTTVTFSTEGFFKIFPFQKLAGSYENIFIDDSSVAISEEVARSLFGDGYLQGIGRTLRSDNDGKNFIVQAIYRLPADKQNTVFRPGLIVRQPYISENKDKWTNSGYIGFFKLKPHTDIKRLEQKLSDLQAGHEKAEAKKYGWNIDFSSKAVLTNIQDIKLEARGSGIDKTEKKPLLILLGLSGLILLLSGINLINLKTAQAAQRAKEVGVRKVLGSSRRNLIMQFLTETFVICLAAYMLAFALAELFLPAYNRYLGKEIYLDDPAVFIGSAVLLLLFTLVAGLIPAVYLSDFRPVQTLKGNFSRSRHGVWLRNAILTLQLVISSFFIICSLIINAQVNKMMDKDLGFAGDQVFQINFNQTNYDGDFNSRKYELQKNRLMKFDGVTDITGSAQTIGNGLSSTSGAKYIRDSTKSTSAGVGAIDFNYFDFYRIPFVAGRDINPKLTSDTAKSVVVNEAFVKRLGWSPAEALGKEISSGMDDKHKRMEIVGVTKDFYYGSVEKEVQPVIFFNYHRNWAKNQMTNLQIRLAGENMQENLEVIKKYWEKEVEPGYPFNGEFVNKNFAKTFIKFQKQKTLFSVLNMVVLIVALLGLFALSSLMVEQKLKDVAIKKALGADETKLVWDLTRKFIYVCLIAVIISFPVSYYVMNEWLQDFAYRIEMPVWPYIVSLVLLLLLTFAVVSFKAFRATKVNPVQYLKYE